MDSDDVLRDIRDIDQILSEVYDYDSDSSLSSEINRDCELINEEHGDFQSVTVIENDFDPNINVHFRDQEQIIIQNCTNPDLKFVLTRNVMLRRTLESTIQKLEAQVAADDAEIRKFSTRRAKVKNGKVGVRNKVGIPYFKDDTKFPSPINSDYKYILDTKRLLMLNFHLKSWTEDDKLQLAREVYSEICAARANELKNELDNLKTKKNCSDNDGEVRNIMTSLKVLENTKLIEVVAKKWRKNTTDDLTNQKRKCDMQDQRLKLKEKFDVTGDYDNDMAFEQYKVLTSSLESFESELVIVKLVGSWNKGIDWYKVSVAKTPMRHSEIECRVMWDYFLNPKFIKATWSESEREQLMNIVDKYHYNDWDTIAKELDINRSPYMCFLYFQSHLCPKIKKERWNREEDHKLLEVVESCRIGTRISWAKVSCFFTERTREQVYNRYRYSLLPTLKKGRFAIEEDILLLTLLKMFGDKNHGKLKPFFSNRHITQIRDRIITLQTDLPRAWTIEEDIEIIKHVDRHGMKKWTLLTLGRNCDSIRHRYNFLVKWFRDNPQATLSDVERRQRKAKIENFHKRSQIVQAAVTKLLKDVQRVEDKNSVLNVDYVKGFLPSASRIVKKRKQPPKRININSESSLEILLYDLFTSNFKLPGPPKVTYDENEIECCANRVDGILTNLDAVLEFPSAEELEKIPVLDELDKVIIEKLRLRRSERSNSVRFTSLPGSSSAPQPKSIPYKFAPNIDTAIGFRGVLLKLQTIAEMARGYLRRESCQTIMNMAGIREYGLKHAFKASENELLELDDDIKGIVMNERSVFEKRFQSMFWWPYFTASSNILPPDNKKVFCDEVKNRKRGRPKKNLAKIQKMREAKRAKFDVKVEALTSDDDGDDVEELMNCSD